MQFALEIATWVCSIASWTCLLTGSFFALVGGIGIIRLPDVFSRLHGSGITDTLGAGLVMVGLMLLACREGITSIAEHGVAGGIEPEPWLTVAKLIMILFFLLVTSPTSAYALAQAALTHDVKPVLANEEDKSSNA